LKQNYGITARLMAPLVKICGITRLEDALGSARAGADFLGYIFYARSKRFLAPRSARLIIAEVRQQFPHVRHVGVFVDEAPADIAWIHNIAGLDYVQLHGHETVELCGELAELGMDVIKALGIDADGARVDYRNYKVNYFLCDTYDANLKGGTGKSFDLNLLPAGLPLERVFLAGGLNPENVSEIVSQLKPFAVDVSSGVEERPGIKDLAQVELFIKNVRQSKREGSD